MSTSCYSEKSKADFWSEIRKIYCSNTSILFSYRVPAASKFAKIWVCSGTPKRGCCPTPLNQPTNLPLESNLTIQVNNSFRKSDTLSIAVFGSSHGSTKVLQKKFNFTNCSEHVKKNWESGAIPVVISLSLVLFIVLGILFRKKLGGYFHNLTLKKKIEKGNDSVPKIINSAQQMPLSPVLTAKAKRNETFSFSAELHSEEVTCSQFTCLSDLDCISPKQKRLSSDDTKIVSIADRISSLYIIFVDESPEHTYVVSQFASFLQQDLGFRVIFEHWERRKAERNYTFCIKRAMNSADKIVVVWSALAMVKLDLFKNGKGFYHDTFSPIFLQMQGDLFEFKNTTKYIFVYFTYSDRNCIPPYLSKYPCYELMTDFEELYFALNDTEKHRPNLVKNYSDKIKCSRYFDPAINEFGAGLKQAIQKATEAIELEVIDDERKPLMSKKLDTEENGKTLKSCISVKSLAELNYTVEPFQALMAINNLTYMMQTQTIVTANETCQICNPSLHS